MALPSSASTPIRTRGLTHIALAVRDLDVSATFYRHLLGAIEVYRGDTFAQLQTPGTWDVIVLEVREPAGQAGGVLHFGFRLIAPTDLPAAIAVVEAAGGTIVEHGEFVPGEPYLFAKDPDGYTIELWYELPTPVDPPPDQP